jgi:hypothetical protein
MLHWAGKRHEEAGRHHGGRFREVTQQLLDELDELTYRQRGELAFSHVAAP